MRDDRGALPNQPWSRIWGLAALLFLCGLLSFESHWRSLGFRPSVTDDPNLWAQARESVYAASGERVVVLLGSSRMQLDVDPAVLQEALPSTRVVQLAISGRHPLAVLRDLAADPNFDGTVVVEATARTFLPADRFGQQPYVDHFHREWRVPMGLERSVATWLQERLTSIQTATNVLKRVGRWLDGRAPPDPPYTTTARDRSVAARYDDADLERVRASREDAVRNFYSKAPIPSPSQWGRLAEETTPWVEAIERRGGRVVFVRLPTTGVSWDLDEQNFPRARYWDRFASRTPADTLHFRDVAEMRELDCPDTSHLDARDSPRFTRALARELSARGALAVPAARRSRPAL